MKLKIIFSVTLCYISVICSSQNSTNWKDQYENVTEFHQTYFKEKFFIVKKNEKYGIANQNGKITIPIIYIFPPEGGIMGVARCALNNENNENSHYNYLYGYINIKTGKIIIPVEFENAFHASNGIFCAQKYVNNELDYENEKCYKFTGEIATGYNSMTRSYSKNSKTVTKNTIVSNENAKTNPNVKSSNQLSKEAKDVYNISKSKQFDKFNTTEVVYNKITYQVKLVKQPGIDIIIINKYKEGIGFTNSCIFNKSNLKPIFDFGKYLVLGRIFKVSNENHYYIPISSINPISDDVKKRSGLYDLTYNEEVFKPNEFYSIDYPYLLDHEANELAPDYYVLELPLNTLQLSPGDIYDNYYLYNIKDKNIISNRF